MGPLIVLMLIPCGLLCFYVCLPESHFSWGRAFTGFLVLASVWSAVALGERTFVLAPLLILGLFYGRVSWKRVVAFGGILLVLDEFVLPFFKAQYQGEESTADNVAAVFDGDLARGPILVQSVEWAKALGSRALPYPGAGYVYTGLFYVPRIVAPFKGSSTASWFTAAVFSSNDTKLNWGFGVGGIEELLLNLGWLGLIPGLVAVGAVFSGLDRLAKGIPAVSIFTSLAGIWFCGYDSTAILYGFGSITIFAACLQFVFTKTEDSMVTRLRLVSHHT
jgi:hypothetical protein